jgi:hypothetical protein
MVRGYGIAVFSLWLMSSPAIICGEETKAAAIKSWDDYNVIAERNIFSRNRTRTVMLTEAQRQIVIVPERRYHTLRGITKESDSYISFIEDSRTSGVNRYRKGDSVAEGKITEITLDNISFKNGGKTLKVEIGMNLEGQASTESMQNTSMSGGPMNSSAFGAMGQGPGGIGQEGQGGAAGQMPRGMVQQGQGGMVQMPGGMGPQGQESGQTTSAGGQFQGRGSQAPGMNQSQATAQPVETGQPSATANLSQSSGQTLTTTRAAKETSESSDEIIQRLKEKRKKELEQ